MVWILMFKLVLEKAEEPEIKLPISTGSSKKQERSRKTSISALLIPNLKNANILHVSRGLFIKLFACQPQEDILYFFAGILYIYEPWLEN